MREEVVKEQPEPSQHPPAYPPTVDAHPMWATANMFPFWLKENYGAAAAPMLHTPFDGFYPGRWPDAVYDAAAKFPTDVKGTGTTATTVWPDAQAQMFFHTPAAAFTAGSPPTANTAEPPYPTDPYPTTSTANPSPLVPNGYKFEMSGMAAPGYYMYPSAYGAAASTECNMFANWIKPSIPKRESSNPPHRVGPGTNNVRVRTTDKYRSVYSDHQRLELEKEWRTQPFITAERKAHLSSVLQLTERQIKIWFQNRRAKDRRERKKDH